MQFDVNWVAVGAVAEVFGLAAVVVSVLYLAAQIRQQTQEIRIAAIHDVTQNFTDTVTPYLDQQFADVWARGTKDFGSLTEGEKIQMISAFSINLRAFQDAYYQASADRLDESVWQGIVRFYGSVLSTPGASRIWELRKHTFSEEFQAFIEQIPRITYNVE